MGTNSTQTSNLTHALLACLMTHMSNVATVMTSAEAADALGVTRRAIPFMVSRGELNPLTGGGGKPFVFAAEEVEHLAASRAEAKRAAAREVSA